MKAKYQSAVIKAQYQEKEKFIMMPPTYRRRGFTLVEMMIVIAIIGVIASIAVPSFMRSRAEGQLTGCVQNLKAIDTALETYLIRHPATSDITVEMLVDAEYLKAAPKCPSTGTCCYSITPCGKPGSQMPYGAYALKCESNAHKAAGCDNGYPKLVTNGDIYYTKN